jgi:hypothetical protein
VHHNLFPSSPPGGQRDHAEIKEQQLLKMVSIGRNQQRQEDWRQERNKEQGVFLQIVEKRILKKDAIPSNE